MERIDAYTFSRAHPIPTGSNNTRLYWAQKDLDPKQSICQIVEFDSKKKSNIPEIVSKFEFLQKSGFPGFLVIDHFRVTENFIAVFFPVNGHPESVASLLSSGYSFSNWEIVRLGMMLLDCYQVFYQANIVILDIE